jgi:hypothetical protein
LLIRFQPAFSGESEKVIDDIFHLIYNQQFLKADSMLQATNGQIDNFYYDILFIDLNWWKHIVSPAEMNSHQFGSLLKNLEERDPETPGGKIRRLIVLSYKLRLEFKRYNLIRVMLIHSEIKQLLTEIDPGELDLSENRVKLFRLYSYLFQYFNNMLNPFLLESKRITRNNSFSAIEHFTQEDDLIVSTLATYFLGKIYLDIEKDPQKGNICFRYLSDRFPENLFFHELIQ